MLFDPPAVGKPFLSFSFFRRVGKVSSSVHISDPDNDGFRYDVDPGEKTELHQAGDVDEFLVAGAIQQVNIYCSVLNEYGTIK